jgi:hypothetical protein
VPDLLVPSGQSTASDVTDEPRAPWSIEQYLASDLTSESVIEAEWRQRRHANRRRGHQLRRRHRDLYESQLNRLREANRLRSVPELLRDLASRWGVAWADAARMLKVSVPALRKWRTSGGVSPENLDRLAGLVAFLLILDQVAVSSPARWIAVPLCEGYTVTPRHLYSVANAAALVDHAAGNVSAVELLDELAPDWREAYRSEYEAFLAADGQFSLRSRRGRT